MRRQSLITSSMIDINFSKAAAFIVSLGLFILIGQYLFLSTKQPLMTTFSNRQYIPASIMKVSSLSADRTCFIFLQI